MPGFIPFRKSASRHLAIARVAALAVVVIGVTVLLGWFLNQRSVMSLIPGAVAMKVNTAICFVLYGIALWAVTEEDPLSRERFSARRQVAVGVTLMAMILAGATGMEYLFDCDLFIDEWLVKDFVQDRMRYFPGRMSPVTVFNFLCMGGALLGLTLRWSAYLVQGLAAGVAFSTLVVIVGTSYGVASLYVGGRTIAVALHTSMALILLCIGVVCAGGNRGIMRLLADRGSAGLILRRLLPAAILVPAVVGWLRMWGESRGLFSKELGISFLSVSNIVTFSVLVWSSARLLRRSEAETHGAQEALQKSLERYIFLADSMPQMVWVARIDGAVEYWNKAWHDYTGMTFEESKGRGWEKVLHPEDLSECLERWKRAVETGEDYQIEYRFRRVRDGAYRWHLGRGVAMRDEQGNIMQWVGTCTDIDDQKRAEEDLACRVQERTIELSMAISELNRARQASELIFKHSLDVICTIDEEGRFSEMSEACIGVWGYQPAELIGRRYLELVFPEDRERTRLAALEIMAGNAASNFENRYLRKDGAVVPVVWSANWSPEARTMFCVARDISDLKRAELELREAKEIAEAANEAKSRFLANMSHEIRTPMNGVIGITTLLLDTALTPEQREYTQTIRVSGESLLILINDILDFSKIEAGKLTLERLDFDLQEVVEGTLELFAETAHVRGIELAGLIEPGVPLQLRGDAGRLRQILTNLIGNGIKFTAEGEVSLRVFLEYENDSEAGIAFHVQDTGRGIALETQSSLFQVFSQGDVSTTRRFGGTGLGLAICKQLVENMGGTIGLRSESGKGALFWFSLPFQKQSPGLVKPAILYPEIRALVIDDNTTSARFLLARLEAWKITAAHAACGAAALEQMRTAASSGIPYGVAFIDFGMPEMDGLAVARAIKAEPALAHTRLIMLTVRGRTIREEELRGAGVFRCHFKPLRQALLSDCLEVIPGNASEKARPAASAVSIRSERILLAEDSPLNQTVALGYLRKLGYAADLVVNGLEALEKTRVGEYDIVLMDYQMPEMDGLQATRAIREHEGNRKHTWIIAMTANAMQGDREHCLAAGMDDYLSKPLRPDALAAALERARIVSGVREGG